MLAFVKPALPSPAPGPRLPGRRLTLVLLLLAAAPACRRGDQDIAPPAGLRFASAQEIERLRAVRDAEFRSDPDSPIPPDRRAGFSGLDYYPIDLDAQYKVRLHRYPEPLPAKIITTRGVERPAVKVGYVEARRSGARFRLQVYQLLDGPPEARDELFLPFLDQTSGVETYGAGRYVDLAPGPDGWYVLDFNLAYHPLCAYGRTDYRCPRTPEENRLAFPVRAGERGWAAHGAAPAETSGPGSDGA